MGRKKFVLESEPRFVAALSSRVLTSTARKAITDELETPEGRKRLRMIWGAMSRQSGKFDLQASMLRTLNAAHLHRKRARGLRVAYIELLTAGFPERLAPLPRQHHQHVQDITQGELKLREFAS